MRTVRQAIRPGKFGVAVAAVAVFCAAAGSHAQPAERPNVVIISADDHAAYVCGAYGNSTVRTPNIDRLAAQGMRFDRAYCNSPVCTASRQSFLTGRYPRTIRVTQLRTALPESEVTSAETLNEAGYQTAAIGKMHFNSDLTHGFDLRLDLPDHRRELARRSTAPQPDVETLGPWRPFRDPAAVWLNASYLPYPAADADMAGTYFARKADEFIRNSGESPFFLMVSFYEPHSPFNFPVEYVSRHDPARFEVAEVEEQDRWQVPEIFEGLTLEEKQRIIASYYTSTEFMDKNVGIVLDAIDAAGIAENTLVIYLGDHGYMLGQHGRFEKHCSYEPAVRAPLIMRYPGKIPESASTAALVEFVDIVPTVLEFCGLSVPEFVQGRSLRPILARQLDAHREHVVVEYAENEEAMIRNERYKLVYITGNRLREDGYKTAVPIPKRITLLFDLLNDPDELTNLADDPAHGDIVDDLLDKLVAHLKATARPPELIPNTKDVHEILAHCLQPRDIN